jgi:hypothetical protein
MDSLFVQIIAINRFDPDGVGCTFITCVLQTFESFGFFILSIQKIFVFKLYFKFLDKIQIFQRNSLLSIFSLLPVTLNVPLR